MSDVEIWFRVAVAVFLISAGAGQFAAARTATHITRLPRWLDRWTLPVVAWVGGTINLILLVRQLAQ